MNEQFLFYGNLIPGEKMFRPKGACRHKKHSFVTNIPLPWSWEKEISKKIQLRRIETLNHPSASLKY
jgi:hypothetical protein